MILTLKDKHFATRKRRPVTTGKMQ